eukprot:6838347-Prymnesium_polylepis.1
MSRRTFGIIRGKGPNFREPQPYAWEAGKPERRVLLRATGVGERDMQCQWASVYLQEAGRAAEARMGLVWWHAPRQSHEG